MLSLVVIAGFPMLFSVVMFLLGLNLAKKYDYRKSILLIAIVFAIAFYVFRLFYVILWSITPNYEGTFVDNLSLNYEHLFGWIDTGESLEYVLDRRYGIGLPEVLYHDWFGLSVMEILFYLFIGAVISFSVKLWREKPQKKFGISLLVLVTLAFYFYVVIHWVYLVISW